MPEKTYPGPFKGSRYTQYKKDPIKGYSRDLILKSGIVHRDTSGEFSPEVQRRKRKFYDDAEKKMGWSSKEGLGNLGTAMMLTGGGTGAVLAWGAHEYGKKAKRDAQERAYKQQDQAGRSASLAKGRGRILPSATRQEINDAVTRNPDAPKDSSVRKDIGGGRRVRPVAGTPRIRLTQEQINERVSRTRKGTEPMAERAPIQPGRRIINDAASSEPSSPTSSKGLPAGRAAVKGSTRWAGKGAAKILSRNYEWLKDEADRDGFTALRAKPSRGVPKPVRGAPRGAQIYGRRETFFGTTERAQKNRAGYEARQASRASTSTSSTGGRAPGIAVNRNPKSTEELKAISDARAARRSTTSTPSTGGRAPGIAVNRDPITTEQKQAIARARNARRAPAPTPPTPPSRTPDRPGGTGGFRAGANGAAEAAARRSAFPSRPGGSGGFRAGANGAAEAAARGEALGWKGTATKTAEVAKTAGKGARVMSGLKLFGKVAGVAAGLAGASELYDRLAPKDWARAPWMSGGKEPVRAPKVAQEQPFTPYPGGTPNTGGNRGGGSGGGSTMTQQARASQRAIRKPDDYLGEAFDATLRKGVNKGTAHLEHMMKMDNLDEDTRANLRQRFKKVQGDQILSQQKDKGIVERLNAEKAGRGENLLKAYRKEGGFNYGKGGKYAEIKRLAEQGTEYAAQ